MIDSLFKHVDAARQLGLRKQWNLDGKPYAMLTLHRPSNVDNPLILDGILKALCELGKDIPIIFSVHPRTKKMIEQFKLEHYYSKSARPEGLWQTDALGYLELLHLNMNAAMVITDSGGLQEETTVLGVPCITLRDNTERPVTCAMGTNIVIGNQSASIVRETHRILKDRVRTPRIPPKWDGKAAERIIECLIGDVGGARPASLACVDLAGGDVADGSVR